MDRRATQQLSLPLNVEEYKLKDHVVQHWNITFARQGKMSVYSKRIMAIVLAQIQEDDHVFKPFYQFHVSQVIGLGHLKIDPNIYKEIKKSFIELSKAVWVIEDPATNVFEPRNILDTTKTLKKDGYRTAYDRGHITIALNPALEAYFIQMSHYTKYELHQYMNFQSWYSMRLWEILSAYHDIGFWKVTISEYRKLMDCEKKYSRVTQLIEKTTAEPLEDFKNTKLEFTVTPLFSPPKGRGRNIISELFFDIVNLKLSPKEELEKWKAFDPERERVINRLLNDLKISDACLVKYLPIIKLKGAYKLIHQYEKKLHDTKNQVNSKERYYNAAIKKMAEEINKENSSITKNTG